jgi:hypothetical protein
MGTQTIPSFFPTRLQRTMSLNSNKHEKQYIDPHKRKKMFTYGKIQERKPSKRTWVEFQKNGGTKLRSSIKGGHVTGAIQPLIETTLDMINSFFPQANIVHASTESVPELLSSTKHPSPPLPLPPSSSPPPPTSRFLPITSSLPPPPSVSNNPIHDIGLQGSLSTLMENTQDIILHSSLENSSISNTDEQTKQIPVVPPLGDRGIQGSLSTLMTTTQDIVDSEKTHSSILPPPSPSPSSSSLPPPSSSLPPPSSSLPPPSSSLPPPSSSLPPPPLSINNSSDHDTRELQEFSPHSSTSSNNGMQGSLPTLMDTTHKIINSSNNNNNNRELHFSYPLSSQRSPPPSSTPSNNGMPGSLPTLMDTTQKIINSPNNNNRELQDLSPPSTQRSSPPNSSSPSNNGMPGTLQTLMDTTQNIIHTSVLNTTSNDNNNNNNNNNIREVPPSSSVSRNNTGFSGSVQTLIEATLDMVNNNPSFEMIGKDERILNTNYPPNTTHGQSFPTKGTPGSLQPLIETTQNIVNSPPISTYEQRQIPHTTHPPTHSPTHGQSFPKGIPGSVQTPIQATPVGETPIQAIHVNHYDDSKDDNDNVNKHREDQQLMEFSEETPNSIVITTESQGTNTPKQRTRETITLELDTAKNQYGFQTKVE